jgi:hypothetical protein
VITRFDRQQHIGRGSKSKLRARPRKGHDYRAAFDGGDPPNAKLGIESMREVVAGVPGMRGQL